MAVRLWGGALHDIHPRARLTFAVLAAVCALTAAGLLDVAPASARGNGLEQSREAARALAVQIAGLDADISSAVNAYSQATRALEAVRGQIRANRRLQDLAHEELDLARATLAARAVTMYKHEDVTAVDAVFRSDDLGELVTQLTMVRALARSDRDVVRTIETTGHELADRAAALKADEKTQQRLVATCEAQLTTIHTRLDERRAALAGVRSDIRRGAAEAVGTSPSPRPTVEPPEQGDGAEGSGPWWPLIRSAAASSGVSARGMYRLMMIESGGSATVVGAGGYYGLFQYAPATWRGGWNPWRSSSISDGAAQIKATALAIRQGFGHAWWDPSFSWAFAGH